MKEYLKLFLAIVSILNRNLRQHFHKTFVEFKFFYIPIRSELNYNRALCLCLRQRL